MQVHVETRRTTTGDSEPVSFSIGSRLLVVSEVLDRWLGQDHSYFKIAADDGALYILRRSLPVSEQPQWELHWFSALPP